MGDWSLYLAGATAVGKSKLALELARRLGGEIISVDSMQVYRGLDIGTDKASPQVRREVKHHLIDVVGLEENFEVGSFVREAREAQANILERGKVPLFCGGTGMYFKAWLEGLIQVPAASAELREELAGMSLEQLCEQLQKKCPSDTQSIDLKNRRRVERALEIALLSGKESSAQKTQWNSHNSPNVFFIILQREKESLIERINQRVDHMFQQGLVEETEQLLKNGLEKNRTAMQAIGYRQVVAYLKGSSTLEQTKEEIKIKTRQFAKRQRTWFRGQFPYARFVEVAEPVEALAEKIVQEYQTFRNQ